MLCQSFSPHHLHISVWSFVIGSEMRSNLQMSEAGTGRRVWMRDGIERNLDDDGDSNDGDGRL